MKVEFKSVQSKPTAARAIPSCSWHAHWLTVSEFARLMGRRPRAVYYWVENGTLAEFGIPVCQFRHGRSHSGRMFIRNVY